MVQAGRWSEGGAAGALLIVLLTGGRRLAVDDFEAFALPPLAQDKAVRTRKDDATVWLGWLFVSRISLGS